MQAAGEELPYVVLCNYGPCVHQSKEPHKIYPLMQHQVCCRINQLLSDCILVPTPEEGLQVCYCKPGQKPLARNVTDLNGETTVALLLNGYNVPVQLPSKLLCMDREKYYCQL